MVVFASAGNGGLVTCDGDEDSGDGGCDDCDADYDDDDMMILALMHTRNVHGKTAPPLSKA